MVNTERREAPNAKINEQILNTRINYIDKMCNWRLKTFYGFMVFFGTIIITQIAYLKSLVEIFGFNLYLKILLSLIIISFVTLLFAEEAFLYQINKYYAKLIKDLKENKIQEIEKYSFWKL